MNFTLEYTFSDEEILEFAKKRMKLITIQSVALARDYILQKVDSICEIFGINHVDTNN